MSRSFILSVLLSLSSIAYSQDLIHLRSGESVKGKVIEISSTSIRYYRESQPDGPIRVLELTDVNKIEYGDGTIEHFVLVNAPGFEKDPEPVQTPRQQKKKRIPEPIFDHGFFFDFVTGIVVDQRYDYQMNYFGNTLKFGNKWFLGSGEKYRFGLQMTWLRLCVFGDGLQISDYEGGFISPLNLGFTNTFKFRETRGLEVNLNLGPTITRLEDLSINPEYNEIGLSTGLAVKFRVKQLAIGVDYTRIEEFNSRSKHSIGISIGAKF